MGRAYVYVAGRTRAAPATEGQKIVDARVTDRLEQCYPGLARNSAQRSVALSDLDRYHYLTDAMNDRSFIDRGALSQPQLPGAARRHVECACARLGFAGAEEPGLSQ